MTVSLSVVVPTYRRPRSLEVCLAALGAQTRPPDEIVAVHRESDEATRTVLADHPEVVSVAVGEFGGVRAAHSGAQVAQGSVVAFTDDDAAPWRDWCARVVDHFTDPDVGALGGRDALVVDGQAVEGSATRVGRITSFGRVIGNHHLGYGAPRPADHLKGVNFAVRRSLLRFPVGLHGDGSQVYNELATCLAVADAGYRLVYDPAVAVDHHWGERFDRDRRKNPTTAARVAAAFNQSYILLSLRPRGRYARMLYVTLVGDRSNGGLLRTAWAGLTGDGELVDLFGPYLRAHRRAWRAAARHPLQLVSPAQPYPTVTGHRDAG